MKVSEKKGIFLPGLSLALVLLGWVLLMPNSPSNTPHDKKVKQTSVTQGEAAALNSSVAARLPEPQHIASPAPANALPDSALPDKVLPEKAAVLKSVKAGFKPVNELAQNRPPKTEPESDEKKARLQTFKNLTEAAKAKQWDEFLALSEQVMAASDYAKHSTLIAAIRDKAPKSVFESLLSRGAQFQAHHLMRAVMMDDLPFLKMLVALGLDIHMTGRNGENAINALVSSLASRKNFAFLLENNVALKKDKNGTPPLTKALNRAIKNTKAVFYAYKLLQHGAAVSDADRALVTRISQENEQSYRLIQRNMPELIGK